MQGSYNFLAQKGTLGSVATQNYYIKLKTFHDKAHSSIWYDLQNFQICCYIDTLANTVSQSTGTKAQAATSNYANVILKKENTPSDLATTKFNAMIKKTEHLFFYNFRNSPFACNSGLSQTTVVLTPFVGNVLNLFYFKSFRFLCLR